MLFYRRLLKVSLVALGTLTIFLGLLVSLFFITKVRPRVVTTMSHIKRNILSLDRASVLASNENLSLIASDSLKQGEIMMRTTPFLLLGIQDSLAEAALLLDSLGQTAEKTTSGVTGLVAPNQSLRRDRDLMRGTAAQLRVLGDILGPIRSAFTRLDGNVEKLRKPFMTQGEVFRELVASTKEIQGDIRDFVIGMDEGKVSLLVSLVGFGLGFVFLLLGLCCLGISAACGDNLPTIPTVLVRREEKEAA